MPDVDDLLDAIALSEMLEEFAEMSALDFPEDPKGLDRQAKYKRWAAMVRRKFGIAEPQSQP